MGSATARSSAASGCLLLVCALWACASPDADLREQLFEPQPIANAPSSVVPDNLPVTVLVPEPTAADLLKVLHRLAEAKPGDPAVEQELVPWAKRSIAFDVAYGHVSVDAARIMAADGRGTKETLDGILSRALGELQHPSAAHLRRVLQEYLLLLAVGAANRPWNNRDEIEEGLQEFRQGTCAIREARDDEKVWGRRMVTMPETPAQVSPELAAEIERVRARTVELEREAVIDCGFGRTLLVATVGHGNAVRLVPVTSE